MAIKLKTISASGIPEALSKAQLYRYLNEPEEAESICRDVLAVDPENQAALRMLGLAMTDQFNGGTADCYPEVEGVFARLNDPYDRLYCIGLLYERRAKAQFRAGRPPSMLRVLFEEAMRYFEEAEKVRPPDNDDALLRWNRCARLLERHFPAVESAPPEGAGLEDFDSAPIESRGTRR
jgi:tetratricopeptide (TPR) repeat protein